MMQDQPQGAVAPSESVTAPNTATLTPAPAPAVAPAPAPAPEKPRVLASELPEDALKQRLESARAAERNALLKEIGYESIEQAKADAKARAAAAEAAKSEAQRAAEERARLVQEAERSKALLVTVTEHATRQMGALTTEQQAAVKAIAGDDAQLQLRAIDALRPTWQAQVIPAPIVVPPAPAPAPAAPPARDTAPRPNAPPDNGSVANVDHAAEYARLKAVNPWAAAVYGNRIPSVYKP